MAESCTGGLVAAALTEIAGSSDVFEAGFVTYSNEAKTKLLHVSEDVIETFGSVSVAVAWAMAQGALAASGADVAVALTGIAGPGGGSDRKPVGTVVFARAERGRRPERDRRRHPEIRRRWPRRSPASGGALRARIAAAGVACAVEGVGALLEGADHPPQRAVEHLPGQRLEDPAPEREIDAEIDLGAALAAGRNFQLLWRYLSGPST